MTLRVLGILLICFASLTGTASAQGKGPSTKEKAEARAHFDQGNVHFNLDEWPLAIEEFRAAYRILPDPVFLYNIAQCHRKMGNEQEALDFYRKYLREKPDAKNRAEVEKRLEELEAALQAAPPAPKNPPSPAPAATEPAPPSTTAPPVPSTSGTTPATSTPAVPAESAALDLTTPSSPSPSTGEGPGLLGKWWFWTGVGAVVVVGATVAIVAARSSTSPSHFQGSLIPGVIEVP